MADEDLLKLRRRAAETRDFEDMLNYRSALKRTGQQQGMLDLHLPHTWQVVGADRNESYGAVRQLLVQLCNGDKGLHPFFLGDARPLTFKETIQARMDQFDQSGGKDWSLWNDFLFTCTGIVWEAGGQRFKIAPMHPDLLTTQPSNAEYLPADFANTPGTPLTVDSTYNRLLTLNEVLTHPGWLAAVEGDAALLQRYAETAGARMYRTVAMGFWTVGTGGLPDHLRPLGANYVNVSCLCMGNRKLNDRTGFARVCPP